VWNDIVLPSIEVQCVLQRLGWITDWLAIATLATHGGWSQKFSRRSQRPDFYGPMAESDIRKRILACRRSSIFVDDSSNIDLDQSTMRKSNKK
jgi:hypothetical protein